MPQGRIDLAQIFTLRALRASKEPLLVVAATPNESSIDPLVIQSADALIWKSLGGYDFSAYGIALHEIARTSPGADVLIMNDSNFGPFSDLSEQFNAAPWDLTGFTGSHTVENHIQSYAFLVKSVTDNRLLEMDEIFPQTHSYNRMGDVVLLQELPLARVAARSMSVGARWYLPESTGLVDPTLTHPLELIESGHPFLKKSLFSKHARFADQTSLVQELLRRGHPDFRLG